MRKCACGSFVLKKDDNIKKTIVKGTKYVAVRAEKEKKNIGLNICFTHAGTFLRSFSQFWNGGSWEKKRVFFLKAVRATFAA